MSFVINPFTYFADQNGSPLDNGSIYIGTTGDDPRTSPAAVYFDSDLTVSASQPISVMGGYPVYQGSPRQLYTSEDECSVLVLDRNGVQITLQYAVILPTTAPEVAALIEQVETATAEALETINAAVVDAETAATSASASEDAVTILAAAAQTAADDAETAALGAQFYPGARSYVPQGLTAVAVANAGTGGTPGTYICPLTGDNFSAEAYVSVVVGGGGTITGTPTIIAPGLYIGASINAGSVDTSAIPGLTSESVTATGGYLVTSGNTYFTDHATDPEMRALFINNANAAVEVDANVDWLNIALTRGYAEDAAADAAAIAALINNDDAPADIPLSFDETSPDPRVTTWLTATTRLFETGIGLGPIIMAYIRDNLPSLYAASGIVAGQFARKYRGNLLNLRGTAPTAQVHHWMTGDSWTERWVIPQAFSTYYAAQGFTIVATGWVGVQSTGTQSSDGSFALLDGAQLTTTGAAISDVTDVTPSGEYSPEGLRATFASGATTSGFTLTWKGRYLNLYFTLNGATLRHVTDGGSNNDVTLASTSAPGKVTIDAGSEGTHTTVLSRPTATNDLLWFGGFAYSALPGVIVSKCGNGGSTMPDIEGIITGTTSAYILGDIMPDATVGTTKRKTIVRMCWLTNDSRTSVSVANFTTALAAVRAAYRTANSSVEIVFAVPMANGVSGISSGFDIGDYLSAVADDAFANDYEIVDYYSLWPVYADATFWGDTLHVNSTGGAGKGMASQELAQFGGIY